MRLLHDYRKRPVNRVAWVILEHEGTFYDVMVDEEAEGGPTYVRCRRLIPLAEDDDDPGRGHLYCQGESAQLPGVASLDEVVADPWSAFALELL